MTFKILTVVGARPQFVKAAVMSRLFLDSSEFTEVLVHTGQHFDTNMSDIFFEQLKMPKPSYNLKISGGSHGSMTGKMLSLLDEVIENEKPDAVLVYGDTNSTLAASLSASKLHIPVFHIEAGLRSFNKKMPEEINRVLTDHVSDLLFCPTKQAVSNLSDENIVKGVHLVGDVMYDATLFSKAYVQDNMDISAFGIKENKYGLVTIHRAENTDDHVKLNSILDYLRDLSQKLSIDLLLPLHPRTRGAIESTGITLDGFIVCEPLSYFDMQLLLSKARLVLTDSGGVQKEAYFHRVPCITLREETEWVETIYAGWNKLWRDTSERHIERKEIPEYGDGNAGLKIKTVISEYIKNR